jgi:rfaE bifunctional protein nucleotidyltransferase chain/domain
MNSSKKIVLLKQAIEQVSVWKSKNEKVVFSNGCFDILHAGHVDYLEKAREKGDRLVVGVNSDQSVTKLKGPSRPIIDQTSRLRIISALAFVDLVVLFEEDTPIELIKTLAPDILVKGKDYEISNIVGADFVLQNGGKVETIELTEGYSSTNVINKVLKQN